MSRESEQFAVKASKTYRNLQKLVVAKIERNKEDGNEEQVKRGEWLLRKLEKKRQKMQKDIITG